MAIPCMASRKDLGHYILDRDDLSGIPLRSASLLHAGRRGGTSLGVS